MHGKFIVLLITAAAATSQATTLYSTSNTGSTVVSGSSGSFVANATGSSSIANASLLPGFGSTNNQILLSLPNLPGFLTSALFNTASTTLSANGSGGVTGASSQGSYSCGFLCSSSSFSPASLLAGNVAINSFNVFQIASPTYTWNGSLGIGVIDLLSLGFTTADLMNGGVLTVQYSVGGTMTAPTIASPGFNAFTNYSQGFNASTSQSLGLALDGDVPEPASLALMGGGLLFLATLRRRRRV